MNRMPNEVLDRIVASVNDQATLVVLSWASRQWRIRVSSWQTLWQNYYLNQFPQDDNSEFRWLRQYEQVEKAIQARAERATNKPADPYQAWTLDWFNAYCHRCATEYRWRHGLYAMRQLDKVASTPPNGVHLQSIPCIRLPASQKDAVVASQWLLTTEQRPTWLLERLCWDGIDMEHAQIVGRDQADEHLFMYIMHLNMGRAAPLRNSLHVWRLAALHKPSRAIVTNRLIYSTTIHRNWLVVQYRLSEETGQIVTAVHDLVKGLSCLDTPGDYSYRCILRAAADGVHTVRVECDQEAFGSVAVLYKLWQ
ncbi:hypothetical protein THASP1DRAFT_30115, partial [Thamnocephalis sphaerospora]